MEGGYHKYHYKLTRCIKNAVIHEERPHGDLNHRIPEFFPPPVRCWRWSRRGKPIADDITGKNSSIAFLDGELKHLKNERERHIGELKRIRSNWADYPYTGMSLSELGLQLTALIRNSKNFRNIEDIKVIMRSGRGITLTREKQLLNIEAQILKEHKRPGVILDIEDIPGEAIL